jgi:hypothetical protein
MHRQSSQKKICVSGTQVQFHDNRSTSSQVVHPFPGHVALMGKVMQMAVSLGDPIRQGTFPILAWQAGRSVIVTV